MSYTKRFIVALCLVLCLASAAFCIDPYKANKDGFGPKIKGLQLGHKMSLMEVVQWGINQGELPFDLEINDEDYFHHSITIRFDGQGKDLKSFKVIAGGRYAEVKKFSGKLKDLLSEIEKLGFKTAWLSEIQRSRSSITPIYLNGDMRISKMTFRKTDFGTGMTDKEFIQNFGDAYHIRMDHI